MSPKEQTHSDDKASAKQRPQKAPAEDINVLVQHPTIPAAIIQQGRLAPRSLTPRDVLQLQRTLGNQAVGRLLAQRAQHQPIQNEASTALESTINSTRGGGQPLDAGVQRSMGQELIAHELTHVVQQQAMTAQNGVVQRMSKGQGMAFVTNTRPWKDYIDRKEFESYLLTNHRGTEENPYNNIPNNSALRQICDAYLKQTRSEELRNGMDKLETPSLENQVKGLVAVILSTALTKIAEKDFHEQADSWKRKTPQWIPVNGGAKGKGKNFYRFCDYTQIEKMLPRIAWETYDDTVESVKAKKRTDHNPNPDHTETWNVIQHIALKGKGDECLRLLNTANAPQEKAVLERAFEHMGNAQTRLSPFVSLSEDLDLLVNSKCPTMQSIIRSGGHLEDVQETAEIPGHTFHDQEGRVTRAKGYERAPHIVQFEIPETLIVTPEMVDTYRGISREDMNAGLGLKAMREAKERLFLGTDIWKFAVAVAANPY